MGNLLNFVSFCDKNTGVCVICGAGYNPENTITRFWVGGGGGDDAQSFKNLDPISDLRRQDLVSETDTPDKIKHA